MGNLTYYLLPHCSMIDLSLFSEKMTGGIVERAGVNGTDNVRIRVHMDTDTYVLTYVYVYVYVCTYIYVFV